MGRDGRNEVKRERVIVLSHAVLDAGAWKAVGPTAAFVYLCFRREWRGSNANNNGSIRLSYRQIRDKTGLSLNTIGRAVLDLQRKGFLIVTTPACLGTEGHGKSHQYQLTEVAMPGKSKPERQFLRWKEGEDFPVVQVKGNNPSGRTQRKSPSQK